MQQGPSSSWPRQPQADPRSWLGARWQRANERPRPIGPIFGTHGVSHFYNPNNTNGKQFNTPAIKDKLVNIAEHHATSQYFKRAGFGAALRYTLGLRQIPSHMTDYINSQTRGQNQTGRNPNPAYIAYEPLEHEHPESEGW